MAKRVKPPNPDRGPMCLFTFAFLVTTLAAIVSCAVLAVK